MVDPGSYRRNIAGHDWAANGYYSGWRNHGGGDWGNIGSHRGAVGDGGSSGVGCGVSSRSDWRRDDD